MTCAGRDVTGEGSQADDRTPRRHAVTGPAGQPAPGDGEGAPDLGAWLRKQREDRFWTRAEMARQLIAAAGSLGEDVPDEQHVAHNIYRWERGVVAPAERYRVYYCKALGIPQASFGMPARPQDAVPGAQAGAILGFLGTVLDGYRELARQLGEPPGEAAREPGMPGADQALEWLRLAWSDVYEITRRGARWRAWRRDGTGRMLIRGTPQDLNAAIREDWACRAGGARGQDGMGAS
jgi:hypothetical protein